MVESVPHHCRYRVLKCLFREETFSLKKVEKIIHGANCDPIVIRHNGQQSCIGGHKDGAGRSGNRDRVRTVGPEEASICPLTPFPWRNGTRSDIECLAFLPYAAQNLSPPRKLLRADNVLGNLTALYPQAYVLPSFCSCLCRISFCSWSRNS